MVKCADIWLWWSGRDFFCKACASLAQAARSGFAQLAFAFEILAVQLSTVQVPIWGSMPILGELNTRFFKSLSCMKASHYVEKNKKNFVNSSSYNQPYLIKSRPNMKASCYVGASENTILWLKEKTTEVNSAFYSQPYPFETWFIRPRISLKPPDLKCE